MGAHFQTVRMWSEFGVKAVHKASKLMVFAKALLYGGTCIIVFTELYLKAVLWNTTGGQVAQPQSTTLILPFTVCSIYRLKPNGTRLELRRSKAKDEQNLYFSGRWMDLVFDSRWIGSVCHCFFDCVFNTHPFHCLTHLFGINHC